MIVILTAMFQSKITRSLTSHFRMKLQNFRTTLLWRLTSMIMLNISTWMKLSSIILQSSLCRRKVSSVFICVLIVQHIDLYRLFQMNWPTWLDAYLGDQWVIQCVRNTSGTEENITYRCKYVAIATGHHAIPKIPVFTDEDKFRGNEWAQPTQVRMFVNST